MRTIQLIMTIFVYTLATFVMIYTIYIYQFGQPELIYLSDGTPCYKYGLDVECNKAQIHWDTQGGQFLYSREKGAK